MRSRGHALVDLEFHVLVSLFRHALMLEDIEVHTAQGLRTGGEESRPPAFLRAEGELEKRFVVLKPEGGDGGRELERHKDKKAKRHKETKTQRHKDKRQKTKDTKTKDTKTKDKRQKTRTKDKDKRQKTKDKRQR